MRNLAIKLSQSWQFAATCAFILAILPFFGLPSSWLSALVVGFVTLRCGWQRGLVVIAFAALPAIALAFLQHPGLFVNTVILRLGLIWLFACILRQTSSWALVIELGSLLGIIVVILVHLLYPGKISIWWGVHLMPVMQQLNQTANLHFSAIKLHKMVINFSRFATGAFAVFYLITNYIILLFARAWQAQLFNPGGLRKELYHVRIGFAATGVLLLCAVGILLQSRFAYDVLPAVMLPGTLAGLSLMHATAAVKKTAGIILPLIYVALIFFTTVISIALAVLGASDSAFDLRSRLGNQQNSLRLN